MNSSDQSHANAFVWSQLFRICINSLIIGHCGHGGHCTPSAPSCPDGQADHDGQAGHCKSVSDQYHHHGTWNCNAVPTR